jgi:hypothetical protein
MSVVGASTLFPVETMALMDFMRLSLRKAARVVVATDALGVIAVFQALIAPHNRFHGSSERDAAARTSLSPISWNASRSDSIPRSNHAAPRRKRIRTYRIIIIIL